MPCSFHFSTWVWKGSKALLWYSVGDNRIRQKRHRKFYSQVLWQEERPGRATSHRDSVKIRFANRYPILLTQHCSAFCEKIFQPSGQNCTLKLRSMFWGDIKERKDLWVLAKVRIYTSVRRRSFVPGVAGVNITS